MANLKLKVGAYTSAAGAKISSFTARTKARFKGLKKTISSTFGMLGMSLGVAGAVYAINRLISGTDKLAKSAKAAQISVEEFQKNAFVFRREGMTDSILSKSFKAMSKNITEAAKGTKTYRDAISFLGVDLGKLEKMTPDKQFRLLVNALSEVEKGSKRSWAAQMLFGRGGDKIAGMADNYEKVRAEIEKTGDVISNEAAASAEQFADDVENLKTKIVSLIANSGLLEFLSKVASGLSYASTRAVRFWQVMDRNNYLDRRRSEMMGIQNTLQKRSQTAKDPKRRDRALADLRYLQTNGLDEYNEMIANRHHAPAKAKATADRAKRRGQFSANPLTAFIERQELKFKDAQVKAGHIPRPDSNSTPAPPANKKENSNPRRQYAIEKATTKAEKLKGTALSTTERDKLIASVGGLFDLNDPLKKFFTKREEKFKDAQAKMTGQTRERKIAKAVKQAEKIKGEALNAAERASLTASVGGAFDLEHKNKALIPTEQIMTDSVLRIGGSLGGASANTQQQAVQDMKATLEGIAQRVESIENKTDHTSGTPLRLG
jgi:hypothetical protein